MRKRKYKIDIASKTTAPIQIYIRDGRAPIPAQESISKVMSANKAKNTKPERILRKALWKEGIRGYRLHAKEIPGKPDIIFNSKKIAVFVNGCFWHRCPYCKLNLPKSNREFWNNKFESNIKRDKKKIHELKKIGWQTITIWECQIKDDISYIVEKFKKVYQQSTVV